MTDLRSRRSETVVMDEQLLLGAHFRHELDGQEFVVTLSRRHHAGTAVEFREFTLTPVTRPAQQPDGRFRGESFPISHLTDESLSGPHWTYLRAGSVNDAYAGWKSNG